MTARHDPLSDPGPLIEQVYRYVAARIGDGRAEDVTGEVFERAVRYRGRYDPTRGEPIAWLIGIARRCIADAADVNPLALVDSGAELIAGDETEQQALRRVAMTEGLARLGRRDRDLIALRFGADLSARQIAELLAMDTHAVEVALSRAVARLRAFLKEPVEPGERTAL